MVIKMRWQISYKIRCPSTWVKWLRFTCDHFWLKINIFASTSRIWLQLQNNLPQGSIAQPCRFKGIFPVVFVAVGAGGFSAVLALVARRFCFCFLFFFCFFFLFCVCCFLCFSFLWLFRSARVCLCFGLRWFRCCSDFLKWLVVHVMTPNRITKSFLNHIRFDTWFEFAKSAESYSDRSKPCVSDMAHARRSTCKHLEVYTTESTLYINKQTSASCIFEIHKCLAELTNKRSMNRTCTLYNSEQ